MEVIMEFVKITSEDFSEFTNQQEKIHFQQTVEMGNLQIAQGNQVLYFGVKEDNTLQTAVLIILNKIKFGYLAEIHGNPYFSADIKINQYLIEELKKELKAMKVIKLIIHSNQMLERYSDKWEVESVHNQEITSFYQSLGLTKSKLNDFELGYVYNYEKDLTEFTTYDDIFKSFKKKAKQSINKAKGFGIEIVELPYERLNEFKEIIDEAGERRQFSTRPLSYYQAAYHAFGDKVKFIVAEMNFSNYLNQLNLELEMKIEEVNKLEKEIIQKPSEKKQNRLNDIKTYQIASLKKRQKEVEGFVRQYGEQNVVIAASEFIILPNEIVYLFSGMLEVFKEFSAPFLIQDYMMRQAAMKKIGIYNFMGVNGPDADQGVLRFKQNFQGYIWKSSGNYELIIRPFSYKITSVLKKILGR